MTLAYKVLHGDGDEWVAISVIDGSDHAEFFRGTDRGEVTEEAERQLTRAREAQCRHSGCSVLIRGVDLRRAVGGMCSSHADWKTLLR